MTSLLFFRLPLVFWVWVTAGAAARMSIGAISASNFRTVVICDLPILAFDCALSLRCLLSSGESLIYHCIAAASPTGSSSAICLNPNFTGTTFEKIECGDSRRTEIAALAVIGIGESIKHD